MTSKNILIATRNTDKFNIVKRLLEDSSEKDFEFVSLVDVGISDDTEEIGSIMERAMGKAEFLVDKVPKEINYIVGIDDGIEVRSVVSAETKKIVDKILLGGFLVKGEVVSIMRAFSIIDVGSGKSKSVMTKVPFKYLGSEAEVKREDGKYPLNFVLSRLEGNNPLAGDDGEVNHDYYLRYSKGELRKLFLD